MFSRTAAYVALIAGLSIAPLTHASQAGGEPALNSRVTVLEGVVTTVQSLLAVLQTKVTALETANTSLQTKVTSLEGANSTLAAALAAETAARTAADAKLASDISYEGKLRQDQVLGLFHMIEAETSARETADYDLANLIDAQGLRGYVFTGTTTAEFLPNGDETIVASVTLPAGNFYIAGKTNVSNLFNNARWGCSLYDNSSGTPVLLDYGSVATINSGLSTGVPKDQVFAHAAVTVGGGTVTFQCHSGEPGSTVSQTQLIAINVGNIH